MSIKIKEKTHIEKIDESNINYKIAYNSKNNKFNYLGNWLEKESTIFVNPRADCLRMISFVSPASSALCTRAFIRHFAG